MKITKDQEKNRDPEIDWILAQKCFYAGHKSVWSDFSPTSKWNDAGPLIEKYRIDIRFFDKAANPEITYEWMGGLQLVSKKTKLLVYYTAFGPTPLIASMKALVKALED